MAKVLRHEPDLIGISIDEKGWVDVSDLIFKINSHGFKDFEKNNNIVVDLKIISEIVQNDDKKRYEFSENGWQIRAVNGHSVHAIPDLKEAIPPDVLWHGTVNNALSGIFKDGISKMSRTHVHLSVDFATATKVASRRGKSVIIKVDEKKMVEDGFKFLVSKNGVWLIEHVPVQYISLLSLS